MCVEAPSQGQKAPPKRKAVRAVKLGLSGGSRKPPTQDELKQRLAKKLAGPWIQNAARKLGYAEALQASKASGKQLFAYFTRSYAP